MIVRHDGFARRSLLRRNSRPGWGRPLQNERILAAAIQDLVAIDATKAALDSCCRRCTVFRLRLRRSNGNAVNSSTPKELGLDVRTQR